MAAVTAEALRRRRIVGEWLSFAAQALIAVSVEVGDDLARGAISQHGTMQGIHDAQAVVAWETAHGLWIEPAWQLFFEHTHRVLDLDVTWPTVIQLVNGIYVFGHIFITLGVALWVYFYHRSIFRFMRNTVILTNAYALLIYENFPVAPPRLTTNLVFNHHTFTFQDTVYGILSNGGKVVGTQLGYNEFSAMPSVHVAWALVVGAALLFLARPIALKAFGLVYPVIMLVAVVVTGNHYLLDAAGAVGVVLAAAVTAAAYEWWARTRTLRFGLVPQSWLPPKSHGR